MEKQTKILLGLGAVIAAYLILKPKKVTAETKPNSIANSIVESGETLKLQECPNGYKLTPKPMGLGSMEVCEDANGNRTNLLDGRPFKSGGRSGDPISREELLMLGS
jgi:hypothetical protein